MISVAHIVEDLKIGGLERIIADLSTGFDKKYFKVRIWCLAGKGEIFEQLEREGVDIEFLGMRSPRDMGVIRTLSRKLKDERIQVVHAHGYTATTLGRIAAVLAGVPVIIAHRHTDYSERSLKRMLIETSLDLFTKRIICCSRAVADYVVKKEGIAAGKVVVIYNGTAGLAADTCSDEKKSFIVGCVASFFPNKGHKYLLQAAAEVNKRLPDKVRFVLVGKGPLQENMKSYAEELGIKDIVDFHGETQDIRKVMNSFEAVVLPSTLREGLGLSLIEAMSCAKPVIGTAVGGIPEVIENGKNGFLIPPRDSLALAEAIIRLAEDPQKSRQMGRAGKESAEKRFSAAKMVRDTEELYCHLLGKKYPLDRPVVLFTSSFSSLQGGGQRSLLLLLKNLDKERWEVLLTVPEEGELSRETQKNNIRHLVLAFPRIRSINIFGNAIFFFRLIRFLKVNKVGLIHTESPREAFYLGLAAKVLHLPLIFHARVSESAWWLDRIVYRFSDCLIAVSRSVARRFNRPGSSKKVAVVYNGVDLREYRPVTAQGGQIPRIGYFGRIHPRKGLDVLIKAARQLRQQVKLVVQGDGEVDYLFELKGLAAGLDIEFRPYIVDPRNDIAGVDLVVLPSIKGEGLSRIIIEAMALGKPVLVSDLEENKEALGQGLQFLAFPRGDPSGLARRIEKLILHSDILRQVTPLLIQRAEECFDIRKNTLEIESIYESLLTFGGNRFSASQSRQPPTLNEYFICPDCRSRLFLRGDNHICLDCGENWPVNEGIPVFLKKTPAYWGEFSREEMVQINAAAREQGWKDTVQSRFTAYLRDFVFDEKRINWEYFIESNTEGTVLDAGSGWGTLAFGLARLGAKVYALEPVRERLEFINIRKEQEKMDNLKPVCAGIRNLPFPDRCFDLVILNGVLEWLGVSETDLSCNRAQEECLAEIFRVLKPGGSLYIGVENRFAFFYFFGVRDPHSRTRFTTIVPRSAADAICRCTKGKAYRTYIYSLNGYRRLLHKAGFVRTDFYLPVPSYLNIRYLVPLEIRKAFDFWISDLMGGRLLFTPRLVRRIFQLVKMFALFPLTGGLVKYLVPDYSIIAKKSEDQ